jgi:hypothetical protein
MKKLLFFAALFLHTSPLLWAQPNKINYPEPEFNKEVYFLKKDSVVSVIRLEKASAKMDSKTKMGGLGGSESGYTWDESKSPVRLTSRNNLSFVFSTGASASSSSSTQDSMMRANGMDPAMMQGLSSMTDPSNTISLYKAESGSGKRKILMMKSPGAMPFGNKKMQSSDKFTFSVKKIREGYWELVIDKPLPKGEYAFTMMGMGMTSMDGSTSLFAFGVD